MRTRGTVAGRTVRSAFTLFASTSAAIVRTRWTILPLLPLRTLSLRTAFGLGTRRRGYFHGDRFDNGGRWSFRHRRFRRCCFWRRRYIRLHII